MVSFPARKCTGVLPHIGAVEPQKNGCKGSFHMSKISGSMAAIPMCHRCENVKCCMLVDVAGKAC